MRSCDLTAGGIQAIICARPTDGRSIEMMEATIVARIVKEHDERRNEILNTARLLFYRKGYDQTSIQDIINDVGIAKGTFYHYFGSKVDLLDELTEHMLQEAIQLIEPILADDQFSALEKFNRYFSDALAWKTENKAFLLSILRALYNDQNAILRRKLEEATIREVAPLLASIIRQGVVEGAFHTDYPDDMAQIVLTIGQWLSNAVALMLLRADEQADPIPLIERRVAAVQQTTERVLSAPSGSLHMVDLDTLKRWFE